MYEPCRRFKEWAIEKQINAYKKTFVSVFHNSSRYFNVFIGNLKKKYPIKDEAEWVNYCEKNELKNTEVYAHFTEIVEDFVLAAYTKHLTNNYWENVSKVGMVECINPECLAFKAWAEKNGYWEKFINDHDDLFAESFSVNEWMKHCNKYKLTGFKIVSRNVPTATELEWSKIWEEYQQSHPKSPAEIFIEWALTRKRVPTALVSIGEAIFKDLKCETKSEFINKIPSSVPLQKIIDYILNIVNKDFAWYNDVDRSWKEYLKTIDNGSKDQLQREEIPGSEGSGTARLGSYDRDVLIEASGCDCDFEAGYEISGENIDVSEADLSFGFDCDMWG